MSHDIQYIFDNISEKNKPRKLDVIQSDIDDLNYLMSIDKRKISLANMDKKKKKLELELDRAKKQITANINNFS
jgi:predicted  nucleic acid-binding Zn-ribbon protein